MGVPVFIRLDEAIHYTLDLYEIGKIYDYAKDYEQRKNGYSNYSYLENWAGFISRKQKEMEDEIWDVINHYTNNAQVYFFDTLKLWLTDIRIIELNTKWIQDEVDKFNDNSLVKYAEEIESEVIKFKNAPNYYRDHKEEYVIEHSARHLDLFPNSILNYLPTTKIAINYKYYCIEQKPDIIEMSSLVEFIKILDLARQNLKALLEKYVSMYDSGKLIKNSLLVPEKFLPPSRDIQLIEYPKTKSKEKIQVNLTVPQIAYLFKMLHDARLIQTSTYKEIHEFIANNFIPSSKGHNEDISVGKIARIWSNFDVNIAAYWMSKFIDLRNLASKDNPNNIKLID